MNRRNFLELSGLAGITFLTGCPMNNVPVSERVKVARAFALSPVALLALLQICDVLVREKSLTAETRAKLKRIADKTESIVEQIGGDVEKQKFDAATRANWDKVLQNLIAEFEAVARLLNPDLDASWAEWLMVASTTLTSIKLLVSQLKTPAEIKSELLVSQDKNGGPQGITAGGVSSIVAYSTNAAIKFVLVKSETNPVAIWAMFRDFAAEYKGLPAIAPTVKKATKKGK